VQTGDIGKRKSIPVSVTRSVVPIQEFWKIIWVGGGGVRREKKTPFSFSKDQVLPSKLGLGRSLKGLIIAGVGE